jgi:IS6 family transposase
VACSDALRWELRRHGANRPMRGLQRLNSARTVTAGHSFVQHLRRGRYEIATDEPALTRVRFSFEPLASAV